MKRISLCALVALFITGTFAVSSAESMISLKIGTTWPQALLSTAICSGDAALEYGIIIDRKVAFGITGDFLWNTKSQDVRDTSTGQWHVLRSDKSFMFPIMGFFMLDPVPTLIVHPAAQFQIGYNSMITGTTGYDSTAHKETSHSDYYYGLIIKGVLDACYDIGERSTLFLGVEYQWAEMKTNSNTNGLFNKRDMSGIGLRAGFRAAL